MFDMRKWKCIINYESYNANCSIVFSKVALTTSSEDIKKFRKLERVSCKLIKARGASLV